MVGLTRLLYGIFRLFLAFFIITKFVSKKSHLQKLQNVQLTRLQLCYVKIYNAILIERGRLKTSSVFYYGYNDSTKTTRVIYTSIKELICSRQCSCCYDCC